MGDDGLARLLDDLNSEKDLEGENSEKHVPLVDHVKVVEFTNYNENKLRGLKVKYKIYKNKRESIIKNNSGVPTHNSDVFEEYEHINEEIIRIERLDAIYRFIPKSNPIMDYLINFKERVKKYLSKK